MKYRHAHISADVYVWAGPWVTEMYKQGHTRSTMGQCLVSGSVWLCEPLCSSVWLWLALCGFVGCCMAQGEQWSTHVCSCPRDGPQQ